jgi:hypothetical protein
MVLYVLSVWSHFEPKCMYVYLSELTSAPDNGEENNRARVVYATVFFVCGQYI